MYVPIEHRLETPNKQKCREYKSPAHKTAYYNLNNNKTIFFYMHEKNGVCDYASLLSYLSSSSSSSQKRSTIFNFALKIRFGRGNRFARLLTTRIYTRLIQTSSLLPTIVCREPHACDQPYAIALKLYLCPFQCLNLMNVFFAANA